MTSPDTPAADVPSAVAAGRTSAEAVRAAVVRVTDSDVLAARLVVKADQKAGRDTHPAIVKLAAVDLSARGQATQDLVRAVFEAERRQFPQPRDRVAAMLRRLRGSQR